MTHREPHQDPAHRDPAHRDPAALPELPADHDLDSLRLLLEAHGWDTRSSARTLGIPYRRLEALRRAYALRSPSQSASISPEVEPKPPRPPRLESSSKTPSRKVPAREATSSVEEVISVPIWGKLMGHSPHFVRVLRQSGRIEPLYVFGDSPSYYTTPQARVLPGRAGKPAQPLEGYVALHELEKQHGPLRDQALRLQAAGQIRLMGQWPTLLGEADAAQLLAGRSVGSHPVEIGVTAKPIRPTGRQNSPSEEWLTDLEPLETPVLESTSQPDPTPPQFQQVVKAVPPENQPFVVQAAWLQLPRFEALWQDRELLILDRGAGGEHWFNPQPQVRFLNTALAEVIFPVLHMRPAAQSVPQSAAPYASPEQDSLTKSAHPVMSSLDPAQAQTLEGLEDAVAPINLPEGSTVSSEGKGSPDIEGETERSLKAVLEETRQQLEQARADLALRQARPPLEGGEGQSRMPDRRVRQLETALREREVIATQLAQLEVELQRALADVGALERPQARASHAAHVRDRLRERFGLEYSEVQVEALNRQVATLPTVGVTKKGRTFKKVQLAEHEVYALVVRDDGGLECIGTVYTLEMYGRAQQRTPARVRPT